MLIRSHPLVAKIRVLSTRPRYLRSIHLIDYPMKLWKRLPEFGGFNTLIAHTLSQNSSWGPAFHCADLSLQLGFSNNWVCHQSRA